jgi:hypothetical protein
MVWEHQDKKILNDVAECQYPAPSAEMLHDQEEIHVYVILRTPTQFTAGVKQQLHEADHSPPSSAKNGRDT